MSMKQTAAGWKKVGPSLSRSMPCTKKSGAESEQSALLARSGFQQRFQRFDATILLEQPESAAPPGHQRNRAGCGPAPADSVLIPLEAVFEKKRSGQ